MTTTKNFWHVEWIMQLKKTSLYPHKPAALWDKDPFRALQIEGTLKGFFRIFYWHSLIRKHQEAGLSRTQRVCPSSAMQCNAMCALFMLVFPPPWVSECFTSTWVCVALISDSRHNREFAVLQSPGLLAHWIRYTLITVHMAEHEM